jgi:21S rRNA (uridine2791-2'-O)-methyltransferase
VLSCISQINSKYRIFSSSQTVIDLGYAPGSWSQVAIAKTAPNGRVIGIDILPVQPPKGVSTIQGNFLSPAVQEEVRAYVQDPARGRLKKRGIVSQTDDEPGEELEEEELQEAERSYLESERHANLDTSTGAPSTGDKGQNTPVEKLTLKQRDLAKGRVVDVVLSDMSAPWEQTTGLWVRSVSNPYHRMMNTSGIPFKDHAGSMVCLSPNGKHHTKHFELHTN